MRVVHEGGDACRVSRRHVLLRAGGLGLLGLSPQALAAARSSSTPGRVNQSIESCIIVFYYGGPSQHDTWDMKPKAPREVRGDFRPIATSAAGLHISEHLPHSARVMDRVAVVRGLHHPMTNHNAAAFAALSGRIPLKGDLELLSNDRNDPPCHGSVVSHLVPTKKGMPPFVALPHVMYNVVVLPGQVAGFLGSAHDPFQVTRDPNVADFRLDELELPGDVSLDRLDNRASMLREVDDALRRVESSAGATALDAHSQTAYRLLHAPAVRRAFDLSREEPKLRDRYGRTMHGQSMLLARRLVESGSRLVTVYDHQRNGPDNWDTHDNNFGRLKDHLLPPIDRAFAALIEDLSARGMLESTLVIAMGEFGRTPRLNPTAGRDHWPFCYSALLAGGGVQGGISYGSSDKLGAYPETDGVTPGDLAATLFWRFGLDAELEIRDLTGRPYRLAEGRPIRTVFGA
jgi:Protein of unknown function (DUF1501)